MRLIVILLFGSLFAVAQTGSVGVRVSKRATPAAKKSKHPPVDPAQDCRSCHDGVTPEVVAEWEGGRHGKALVPCVTCHGATDASFVRSPHTEKCRSCHPAQHATTAFMKGRPACYACHPPHSLNPHLLRTSGGDRR